MPRIHSAASGSATRNRTSSARSRQARASAVTCAGTSMPTPTTVSDADASARVDLIVACPCLTGGLLPLPAGGLIRRRARAPSGNAVRSDLVARHSSGTEPYVPRTAGRRPASVLTVRLSRTGPADANLHNSAQYDGAAVCREQIRRHSVGAERTSVSRVDPLLNTAVIRATQDLLLVGCQVGLGKSGLSVTQVLCRPLRTVYELEEIANDPFQVSHGCSLLR